MQYTTLGSTGLKVSRLCMGTMTFGREADEKTSEAMFHRCREAGINFFDCANVYAKGDSERILGRLIDGCRDELVITTKVGMTMDDSPTGSGLSPAAISEQIDASLDRLGVDCVDVYFAHRFDEDVPLEQTLRAFDDVVRAGKARKLGASNFAAWQLAKARGVSAGEGLAMFEVMQPMYSLIKRQAEVELLPLASVENMGVINYSPLAGGVLTGKYSGGRRPDDVRLTRQENYAKRYGEPSYFDIADAFVAHARERGVHPATLAVAWSMNHPAVTAPIIGARDLDQLEPSLAASELDMSDEWRQEISELSIDPPPATDRLEEKR
jgi:aryl-alcohol dehydrogenase-like predicted oxidoreductase